MASQRCADCPCAYWGIRLDAMATPPGPVPAWQRKDRVGGVVIEQARETYEAVLEESGKDVARKLTPRCAN